VGGDTKGNSGETVGDRPQGRRADRLQTVAYRLSYASRKGAKIAKGGEGRSAEVPPQDQFFAFLAAWRETIRVAGRREEIVSHAGTRRRRDHKTATACPPQDPASQRELTSVILVGIAA